jgi:hypothetical protein
VGAESGDERGVPESPSEQNEAIESAVAAIAGGAPSDWVRLHAEFGLVDVSATVTTESSTEPAPLTVPPEALQDIASHQRNAAQAGKPWHRLIIDRDRTGRLSVQEESVSGRFRLRRSDARAWSVATRSAPFVIQLVLGVLMIAMWLVGKWSIVERDTRAGDHASLLIATGITVVIALLAGGALLSRQSTTTRAIGLSVAASALVVLIGGVGYAFYLF